MNVKKRITTAVMFAGFISLCILNHHRKEETAETVEG